MPSEPAYNPRDSIHVYHEVQLTAGTLRLACEEYRDDPDLTFTISDGMDNEFVLFHVSEIPALIEALQRFAAKIAADLEREPARYAEVDHAD